MAGKAASEVLMTNYSKYQIFPYEPKPIEEIKYGLKDVEGIGAGIGCLVWGGIVSLVFIPGLLFEGLVLGKAADNTPASPIPCLAGIFLATGGTIAIHFMLKRKNVRKLEQERKEERERKEKLRVEQEAASKTSKLRHIYESSASLQVELKQHLKTAVQWLRHAKREYGQSAYSPFWDAVENAASSLADYEDALYELSDNAESYYEGLKGRTHSFPAFPVTAESLPDASSVVRDFQRIVRLGLAPKDPTFALIWEHYKDRKVMMAGFQHLGEAIKNLGSSIEDSVLDWRESISSDLARSVEEEIKSREVLADIGQEIDKRLLEQNRLLDNI